MSKQRAISKRRKLRRRIPKNVRQVFNESKQYFQTPLQEFVYYRNYSRFRYDLGRRETWPETVERAVSFLRELSRDKLPPSVYDRIHNAILHMEIMPSMRLIAMAGEAAKRDNVCIYNCSYLPVSDISAFVEALAISMAGCGVGFSVEKQYVDQLPEIKPQRNIPPEKFVIPDSTEGWMQALRLGLERWFEGYDVEFDYSQIRPAGAVLRTKGGRASGPEPLRRLLNFARKLILSRQGKKLRPIDAYDLMCYVGSIVVQGGVRRSAMICLFDFDDDDMLYAKHGDLKGKEHRYYANNSAVFIKRMSYDEIKNFMLLMHESGRGEPGIFSRYAANNTKPPHRVECEFGCNPCVTADTWVLTDEGYRQVRDLIDKSFTAVVHGKRYQASGFWNTGVKDVYRVRTKRGYTLKATADHLVMTDKGWVAMADLKAGDKLILGDSGGVFEDLEIDESLFELGWVFGQLVGNGGISDEGKYYAYVKFWGEHAYEQACKAYRILDEHFDIQNTTRSGGPIRGYGDIWMVQSADFDRFCRELLGPGKWLKPSLLEMPLSFQLGFLQGYFDCDGSVQGSVRKGRSIRLTSTSLHNLEMVQLILSQFGIESSIYTDRRQSGYRLMPDGKGGLKEYFCKACHELVVSRDNILLFYEIVGFSHPDKAERLQELVNSGEFYRKSFKTEVVSVEYVGKEEVYDCSVEEVHAFVANGVVVHNCGEVVLRPYEFCNLSSVVARPEDDLITLMNKVELATIVGTIQSLATHFPNLRPDWYLNCVYERLIGVDINGHWSCEAVRSPQSLRVLREHVERVNSMYAAKLNIRPSAATTVVKPSGNSSTLLNVSSGLHPWWSRYYIRNVRLNVNDPLFSVLSECDVSMTQESDVTFVVHFPVKAPDNAITWEDITAMDLLNYWLDVKLNYTTHNPSVTVLYEEDELEDIIGFVYENQDVLGGVTFLPRVDPKYDNMPYVAINEEVYNDLIKNFPDVDYSLLYKYEKDDHTSVAQTVACTGGKCEFVMD